MWDLPGPGLEPVSPALAGGFLSTAPPGKSQNTFSFSFWKALFGLVFKIYLPEKHNIISHVGVGISVVLLSAQSREG